MLLLAVDPLACLASPSTSRDFETFVGALKEIEALVVQQNYNQAQYQFEALASGLDGRSATDPMAAMFRGMMGGIIGVELYTAGQRDLDRAIQEHVYARVCENLPASASRTATLCLVHADHFLGRGYYHAGADAQAEQYFSQALGLCERNKSLRLPICGLVASALAEAQSRRGNPTDATVILETELARLEAAANNSAINGSDLALKALALNNLAANYSRIRLETQARDHYLAADRTYQQLEQLFPNVYAEVHRNHLVTNVNLLGYDRIPNRTSQQQLDLTLSLYHKLGESDLHLLASIHNTAGGRFENAGNLAKAIHHNERALFYLFPEGIQGLGNPDSHALTVLRSHGNLLFRNGQIQHARNIWQIVLNYWEQSGRSPQHPDLIDLHAYIAASLTSSDITLDQLELLLTHLRTAVGGLGQYIQSLARLGSEAKVESKLRALREIVYLMLATIDSQKNSAIGPKLGYVAAELVAAYKGVAFDTAINRENSIAMLAEQGSQAAAQAMRLRAKLAAFDVKGTNFSEFTTLAWELDQVTERVLSTTLTVEFPKNIASQLVRNLDPNALFLDYVFFVPPKIAVDAGLFSNVEQVAAIGYTREEPPTFYNLGSGERLASMVANYRQHISNLSNSQIDQELLFLGNQLYQELIQPMLVQARQTKQLIISADGFLQFLPFSALVEEKSFLIEKLDLVTVTSARALVGTSSTPLDIERSFVVLGSPSDTLDEGVEPIKAGVSVGSKELTEIEPFLVASNLGMVPWYAEFLATFGIYADALIPGLFLGDNASETSLTQTHSPTILHISSHGSFAATQSSLGYSAVYNGQQNDQQKNENAKFDSTVPFHRQLGSHLYLEGYRNAKFRDARRDGVFTAFEMAQLKLNGTHLAFLSACETGLANQEVSQGVYGFRRALEIAGARSQIVSMWRAGADATERLVAQFYSHLMGGATAQQALRKAKLTFIADSDKPELRHPFYWAPFEFSGQDFVLP